MRALIGRELRYYNTEALMLKMAVVRFLDVFLEKTSKMKENAVSLIITSAIILKQLFSSGFVNIVGIIPSTSPQGLFDNIHFAFGD